MLPHYFAAPTLITLGGIPHLADRLRLGEFAALLQGAADALGRDSDGGDLPEFSSPDVLDWIRGPGMPLVFFFSLRRNEPGLRLMDAYTLAQEAGDEEKGVVLYAALRHSVRKLEGQGEGVDVALLKWGQAIRYFAENGKGLPTEVAGYTLDQADLLLAGDDPEAKQEAIEQSRLWAEWEAEHLRIHGPKPAEKTLPGEVTLADYGYAILPDQTQAETRGDD